MPTTTCPKCNGSGAIHAFAHYAAGVCFDCSGSGRLEVGQARHARRLTDHAARCCDWIIAQPAEAFERLSFEKLEAAREYAHQCDQQYPGVYAAWKAKAEPIFQRRQRDLFTY